MFSHLRSKKGERKKDKEIALVVDADALKVSRSALVKHSALFRKMADNGELKGSKEVRLKGVTTTGLHKIVEYMRSECVYFQNHQEAIEGLRAAYLYQVTAMDEICANFLVTAIDSANVCDIFELSASYSFHLLEYHCLRFIDQHPAEVLQSESFLGLKRQTTVADIVRRNSLDVPTEKIVFGAVMAWARGDCDRRGVDPQNFQEVFKCARPLLDHVRFAVMADDEMPDPDVDSVRMMLSLEEASGKRRSLLNFDTRSMSGTTCCRTREYVAEYDHLLEMLRCDEHAVKNGESFCLRIEVLKGRVFLTGLSLAFDRFVSSKNTSCLYAAVSATNVQSAEQRCARGTFMTTPEEAVIRFPSPLVVGASESVEIALQVKRAVNICAVVSPSDVQIAVPDSKEVALKILPSSERSMFKGIKYFY